MGWKNWSYWLRGGLISLFFGLILLLVSYLAQDIPTPTDVFGQCSQFVDIAYTIGSTPYHCPLPIVLISDVHQIAFFISLPLAYVWSLLSEKIFISDKIAFVDFIFGYIVLGIVVGWSYGKIKERRNS